MLRLWFEGLRTWGCVRLGIADLQGYLTGVSEIIIWGPYRLGISGLQGYLIYKGSIKDLGFRASEIRGTLFGVLTTRILLFRVLY